MTKGPFGGPRPLASGHVILLATVEDTQLDYKLFDPEILESDLELDDWDVSVELDESVDTYAIDTELSAVELDELNNLSEDVERNIGELLGMNSTVEFSVGFR